MDKSDKAIGRLVEEFTVTQAEFLEIAQRFRQAMADGLSGGISPLKMLPSYLTKPSGKENGRFLAVDFGGTNVRVVLTELSGQGRFSVLKYRSAPLRDPQENYDYTSEKVTGQELFDFIADNIARLIDSDGAYPLGHTFSFPCRQTGVNQAELIFWTKEIQTAGVEGQDINQLLGGALARRRLVNVHPCALINDTVGTLLAAAYADQTADIASICGTGHNTCYLEMQAPPTGMPMIINMESGNFDQLPYTVYDTQLDSDSERPGVQRLEKMVSGRYIGELARLVIIDFAGQGLLQGVKRGSRIDNTDSIMAEDLAVVLADHTPDLSAVAALFSRRWDVNLKDYAERQIIYTVAKLVVSRSARLVAATYLGVLQHIDQELSSKHTIAIDGALFEKMPGYSTALQDALSEALQDRRDMVGIRLAKDGSGIGAAIAAAIAWKK